MYEVEPNVAARRSWGTTIALALYAIVALLVALAALIYVRWIDLQDTDFELDPELGGVLHERTAHQVELLSFGVFVLAPLLLYGRRRWPKRFIVGLSAALLACLLLLCVDVYIAASI
jgi:hypothetical protein